MTEKEKIELLTSQVEALLENQSKAKPQTLGSKLKEGVSRSLLNIVDDPTTTFTGVGVAVAVVATNWPNIDHMTIIEAFGFSSLGGISNGKSPSNANTFDENELG